jgi:hypothetical protein
MTIDALHIEEFIHKLLNNNPRYKDLKNLNRYEHSVFSQNGEDGIIAEIFNRVGTTNKIFVEFGAGNTTENNTITLLLKNWRGFWFDADLAHMSNTVQTFHSQIDEGKLVLKPAFVSPDNVEGLFAGISIPEEFDLLSIDIDGNDFWVWKAIEKYHPRVVVIEYNGLFTPDIDCVIKYNPSFKWNGTTYFGASLKALERLGTKKGYTLVGCDIRGINAFFIRDDLVQNLFQEPYTAENHYEPLRHFLIGWSGTKKTFGEFVTSSGEKI